MAFFVNLAFVLIFQVECPWKSMFDIDCAGCGATRMLISMIHLDFYQALRFNPFIFISLILVILYSVYILLSKVLHREYKRINSKVVITYVVLLFAFMILRNISLFSYLKPTVVR